MRIAFGISYQGGAYHGWQSQTKLPCIQTYLERAISRVADHSVRLQCAGRTDKGVHALSQVVHFDTDVWRSKKSWLFGSNSYLPPDIRVNWVQVVEDTFHARFSALARRYRYIIYNRHLKSALWNAYTSHCCYPLNEKDMHRAAQYLVGEHDFSSFRAASCQANHALREIQHIQVKRHGDYVIMDIQANAFLHHMVRNISAVLMLIGQGKKSTLWAQEVLFAQNRKMADVTASPTGLYLSHVIYPERFSLPQSENHFFNFLSICE
ncbi:tRNA pseudouridine(38-40) synthase TruA [Rickettsiella grylli]|uniref:tRNA pseudouridine synthase A n=1 Tax=Rickettsiella grylli TaxID=59196 RepID=A8PMC8_9COXI|nr:tRNA pseudouridine(38-40) synthase TruA [Rickettsiella grylli]EDP46800.1 tRNA pseudouridine synthase A [Rickettsiella grylli]